MGIVASGVTLEDPRNDRDGDDGGEYKDFNPMDMILVTLGDGDGDGDGNDGGDGDRTTIGMGYS